MTRFLKNIFFITVLSAVLYPVLIVFWGELAPRLLKKNLNYKIGSQGHMFTKIRELDSVLNPDILVLGSSTVYRGYDPRIFKENGIDLFNLGSSAQTPVQTNYLLRRYLKKINPDLFIYDVSPLVFSIDGIESSLDLIANDRFNFGMVKMAFQVNHIKIYNTLLYAFYVHLFDRYRYFKESIVKNRQSYIKGGYVEYQVIPYHDYPQKDNIFHYNDDQFEAFTSIISFLEANEINYLLIQPPIAPGYIKSVKNSDKFNKFMQQHKRYIDFNQFIQLNDSLYFEDQFHLNKYGVEKYNEQLINFLLTDSTFMFKRTGKF